MNGSVQFSHSTVSDALRLLCDCRTPGLAVHHQLPEFSKLMSTEWVMPPSHLILCHPLLLPPSTFPSIRVLSNESARPRALWGSPICTAINTISHLCNLFFCEVFKTPLVSIPLVISGYFLEPVLCRYEITAKIQNI